MEIHKPNYVERLLASRIEYEMIPNKELSIKSMLKDKVNALQLLFISTEEIKKGLESIDRKYQALSTLKEKFHLNINDKDIVNDIKNGLTHEDIHKLTTSLINEEEIVKIIMDKKFDALMYLKREFNLNISVKDIMRDLQEGMSEEDVLKLTSRLLDEKPKTEQMITEEAKTKLPIIADKKYLALMEINLRFNLGLSREDVLASIKPELSNDEIVSLGNKLLNDESFKKEIEKLENERKIAILTDLRNRLNLDISDESILQDVESGMTDEEILRAADYFYNLEKPEQKQESTQKVRFNDNIKVNKEEITLEQLKNKRKMDFLMKKEKADTFMKKVEADPAFQTGRADILKQAINKLKMDKLYEAEKTGKPLLGIPETLNKFLDRNHLSKEEIDEILEMFIQTSVPETETLDQPTLSEKKSIEDVTPQVSRVQQLVHALFEKNA